MSRNEDEDEVPLKFDDKGNPINNDDGTKLGASASPTLKDLMRRLEKLTTENKKLRAKAKDKKTKWSSSSSEEEDSSFGEEVSKRRRKKEEITISEGPDKTIRGWMGANQNSLRELDLLSKLDPIRLSSNSAKTT
jgi:hypothetical protein